MQTSTNQFYHFISTQIIILFIGFILLAWIFPVGGNIDMFFIAPWVDQFGQFPYKNNWFTEIFFHKYLKNLLILIYSIIFFIWLASLKLKILKEYRVIYGYFFIVSMICTLAIAYMKAHAIHACPWDMTIKTPTSFYWNFNSTDGKCFPGGHASAGFALVTGYFAYRDNNTKRANFFLILGLILGWMMGWTQMMRGAHFLSHNLWSAWIIWCINTLIYGVIHLSWFKNLKK